VRRLRRLVRAVVAVYRAALMTALQYRASFLGEAFVALFWLVWTIAPLFVLYQYGSEVAGWSRSEALLVMGFFITLSGILDAFVDPNLTAVVQHVREGTLDFVLLKPVDPQLYVSIHRTAPAKLPHVLAGLAVAAVATASLPVRPGPGEVAAAAVLLCAAVTLLHSLWTLVVSLSFRFVRVDNLSFLLRSVVDAGRWPVGFYPVAVRIALTFLVPVALMTSYPALALRGALSWRAGLAAVATAVFFALLARFGWKRALRGYASASS
jgi:ABC-2 type transport system permease protein